MSDEERTGQEKEMLLEEAGRDPGGGGGRPVAIIVMVVLAALLLFILFARNYERHRLRSAVARVRADHRTLATAIESYYVDVMCYPAHSMIRERMVTGHLLPASIPAYRTFRLGNSIPGSTLYNSGGLMSLTTPIAYIKEYPADPFADVPGTVYPFYMGTQGWILGSWGPDGDQDTGGDLLWAAGDEASPKWVSQNYLVTEAHWETPPDESIEIIYDAKIAQPSNYLLGGSRGAGAFTYDPTNGAVSEGDIWRVKQ